MDRIPECHKITSLSITRQSFFIWKPYTDWYRLRLTGMPYDQPGFATRLTWSGMALIKDYMTTHHPPVHQIELRINQVSELFNSMDPTPFPNRNLDKDAEDFLEEWALEFPANSQFRVVVHMGQMPADDPTRLITDAIHNYFSYKAVRSRRKLRVLMLEGRAAMLIGIAFLALCLIGADLLAVYTVNTLSRLLKESLLIGGWVALWRPLQIFLYDWWPIVRRMKIYRNLGKATVHVTPGHARA